MKIYFDYAAATPLSPTVFDAMKPFFTDQFYNPSALYLDAQSVANEISNARAEVAKELGCKSSEIIFTAGGTESDNLAINGVMQQFVSSNLVVSKIEHDAVLEPAKQYDHSLVNVTNKGLVDIEDLKSKIDDKTVLVSIMYANNEVGTIQPIKEVAKLVKEIKLKRQLEAEEKGIEATPIYLHTDACQAANYLPLLVNTLGVDLMTLNGGKIYGPKQSGILFVRTGTKLIPQILGGGQERGIRSGTESVTSIIGFSKALTEAAQLRDSEVERLSKLRDKLINYLIDKNIVINGAEQRLANNVHFTIPGIDNERLMMELDEKGVMVATGSACSASSDEPSHVLKAMNISDNDAKSSIRLTLGRQTTMQDIDQFILTLEDLI